MKILKHPKRIHYILATLLVLNVAAFFTVSAITPVNQEEISTPVVDDDSETYFDSGLNVLNWSYSLLRYFRHPG